MADEEIDREKDGKKKPADIRTKAKLLMVEVNDGDKVRKLFTPKKNFPYLIEFSRIYNARLVEVLVDQVEALSLATLVDGLNDSNFQQETSFKELLDLTPMKLPFCRPSTALDAVASNTTAQGRIQSEIRRLLLNRKVISTKNLIEKFKQEGFSDSTIRRHFRIVRSVLEDQGHTLKKNSNREWLLFD